MRRLLRAISLAIHPQQCPICLVFEPNHNANCPRGKRGN